MVSNDVLKIGEPGDAIRVNCSHRLSQQIADQLGCIVPTAKLSDEIWKQADLKLEPPTQAWDADGPTKSGTMGQNTRMIDFDRIVTGRIASRPYILLGGQNKDWINCNLLGTPQAPSKTSGNPSGCNYGFHTTTTATSPSETMPGVRVWQGPALKHDWLHSDYSQMLRLIKRWVFVCGPAGISGFGQEAQPTDLPCPLPGGGAGVASMVDIYNLITNGGDYTNLVSAEGQISLRHPAMGDPPPLRKDSCSSVVSGACDWPPPDGQQVAPADEAAGMSQAKALAWLAAGAVGGYLLVRSVPSLVRRFA